jgi:hypothetical protein
MLKGISKRRETVEVVIRVERRGPWLEKGQRRGQQKGGKTPRRGHLNV